MSYLLDMEKGRDFSHNAPLSSDYRIHFNSDHSRFVTDWDDNCLDLTGYTRRELGDPRLEIRIFGQAHAAWMSTAESCFACREPKSFIHKLHGRDRVIRVKHTLSYLDSHSLLGTVLYLSTITSEKKPALDVDSWQRKTPAPAETKNAVQPFGHDFRSFSDSLSDLVTRSGAPVQRQNGLAQVIPLFSAASWLDFENRQPVADYRPLNKNGLGEDGDVWLERLNTGLIALQHCFDDKALGPDEALRKTCEVVADTLNPGRVRIVLLDDGKWVEKNIYDPGTGQHRPGQSLAGDGKYLADYFGDKRQKTTGPGMHVFPPAELGSPGGQMEFDSVLHCPIRVHGKVAGFLSVEDVLRVWKAEEQNFTASIADFCSLLLLHLELESSRRGMFNMLSSFPGMAARIRMEERKLFFEFVTEGCLELTGYGQDHFLNHDRFDCLDIVHHEDLEPLLAAFDQACGPVAEPFVFRLVRKDGQLVWLWSSFKLLRQRGDVRWFQGFYMDQTELYKLRESELISQARNDFMAAVSHELRTPLNAILGLSHLIGRTELSMQQRNYLNKITESATKLLEVVSDVLTFVKVDKGQAGLERVRFSPEQVFCELSQTFGPELQAKGVEFKLSMENDIPRFLVGDVDKLVLVLGNLLENAVKYTSRGSVSLGCTVEQCGTEFCRLQFSICDTGLGIPDREQKKVFAAFTQAEDYQTRRHGGMGLGLTISKSLADQMGGEIFLRSNAGSGTCVTFSCPFSLSETAAATSICPELRPEEIPQFHRERILLAEDNEINQLIAVQLLENANLAVTLAENGEQALNLAVAEKFDLVLMDLQMPVMDGFQAVKAIRQLPGWQLVPILALTAHAFEEEKQRCFLAGMDGMLAKPIDIQLFYETIAKHLHFDSHMREFAG